MMEIDLTIGASDGVVRIDNTVRKPPNSMSTGIEALLQHLEAAQFEYSPRFLGYDSDGRQILSYIAGDVGHYPAAHGLWSEKAIVSVAKMLRRFHDVTQEFDWESFEVWPQPHLEDSEPEVLCHNDVATYNVVFSDSEAVGLIDYDLCAPGSRAWDLACMAFRFLPICNEKQQLTWGAPEVLDVRRRLGILLDAYGFEDTLQVLKLVPVKIAFERDQATVIAKGTDRNAKRIRTEGHVDAYNQSLAYFDSLYG